MSKITQKLVLIDGNALIHRAYHAIPPLMTKKGELVNAVYGFSSTILSVINKFQPDYIIATFDLAGPTFRHLEYEKYKATRTKTDQELYDQIPKVKKVVRAMGIPIVELAGYEADDVIGTLSQQAENLKKMPADELKIIIVTGDLDTLQLVSKKTQVYTMRRGIVDSVLYDIQKVNERYGIQPIQIIDYKGLSGDASDNIPGVKGIGGKTATKLLQTYGTIENIYSHIDEVKGSLKEKLVHDKMQALQSKHLATIVRNIPIKLNLKKAKIRSFERQKLVKLFQSLNFFSLIKRIPISDNDTKVIVDKKKKSINGRSKGEVKDFKYQYVIENKIEKLIKSLESKKEIAIWLDIKGEKIFTRELMGIAFSWKVGRASYIKITEQNITKIKDILANEKIKKIHYNLKKDLEVLHNHQLELKGETYDVMLAAYVLDPGKKNDLAKLVLQELGEEIKEDKNQGQLGLDIESETEKTEKNCQRADYIFKLKTIYEKKIQEISQEQTKENNLHTVFCNLEMPLVKVLAEMEINGVYLNTIIFQGIAEKIQVRIKKLEEIIYKLAGRQFNLNSPKQLAGILFEELKLPTKNIKKGKNNFSTASSELQKLKEENKIIAKIEEYREIFKLKTTYLDTLPLLVDKNSRVHSTFNQAVTATGRLSSSDPNLQNIPTKSELGQLLRVAFEATDGWCLISADYSQIDLRVMAHMSEDKKMIDLFWRGEDIHQATAAEINKVTMSKVTQKMRRAAKALNFGIIYGMGTFGFAQSAGISREEAKKFIQAYFEKFIGVTQYIKETKKKAKQDGYVETQMGRRRYIPEINSPNFQVQNSAERMAINMPIQGMSADIVKLAMIKVYAELKDNPQVRMILQIHDEIILEVKEEVAESIAQKIKNIMEQVYKLKVPLMVNIKMGANWGEL